MDFAKTEAQGMVEELAASVLAGAGDPWKALAEAGLLGVSEHGFLPLCSLLVQIGRAGVATPALPTLAWAGLAIERFGTEAQKARWLDGVVTGERTLAAALSGDVAERGGRLRGAVGCVPGATRAHGVLVRAGGLWLTEEARVHPQRGTGDDTLGEVVLEDAAGEPLAGPEAVGWVMERAQVAIAAVQLGVATEALAKTARYVSTRHQFGVPIGTFQAVSQRLGDAYVDVQAMEVTLWRAACRLDAGLDAAREARIARFWANDAAHRVLATAQHLHAGIGFDRDYPLHRYFLLGKQLEFTLGGASEQLAGLGELIAG